MPNGLDSMNQREVAKVVCEMSSSVMVTKNRGNNEGHKLFNMAVDKLSTMPNLDPTVAEVLDAGKKIKNMENQAHNATHNVSMRAMDEACRRL